MLERYRCLWPLQSLYSHRYSGSSSPHRVCVIYQEPKGILPTEALALHRDYRVVPRQEQITKSCPRVTRDPLAELDHAFVSGQPSQNVSRTDPCLFFCFFFPFFILSLLNFPFLYCLGVPLRPCWAHTWAMMCSHTACQQSACAHWGPDIRL